MDTEMQQQTKRPGVDETAANPITVVTAPQFSATKNGNVGTPANAGKQSKKKRIARPMNSFMVFAQEYRAQLRTTHPEIDNKEISKMLGQKWKNLTEQEKKKYVNEAERLAEQHKKDHPDWKFVRAPPRKKPKAGSTVISSDGTSDSNTSCKQNDTRGRCTNLSGALQSDTLHPAHEDNKNIHHTIRPFNESLSHQNRNPESHTFPFDQSDPLIVSAAVAALLRTSHGDADYEKALGSYIASGGLNAITPQSLQASQQHSRSGDILSSTNSHIQQLAQQQIELQKMKLAMVLRAASQNGSDFLQSISSFDDIHSHSPFGCPKSMGSSMSSDLRGAPPGYVQPPPA
eukprot:m.331593 g.331593  ORF g.331593 m.331593 type:complete len:345 (-) comp20482_c0_seq1:349-1383(-)